MFTFLALISTVALASAFPTSGKEFIYDYQARIRVGTNEPVSFASQFTLEGKLHMQHESINSSLLRFTDLKFKLYNGELNYRAEFESKALPLPQESVDLLRVFRVESEEDGKLRYLSTEAGEHQWSRNIKKAVASLLQLDMKNIQIDSKIPHSFITEERGIYGRGLVEYNVMPQDDKIIIQKMQDVKSSRHWYRYFGINLEPLSTGSPINSPLSIVSQKQYTLDISKDNVQIERLEAQGKIHVSSFSGAIEPQCSSVEQTLQLSEVVPIENNLKINSEERTDQLEFKLEIETESGDMVDLSLGRHRTKPEELVRLTQNALNDALNHLDENQLTLDAPDFKKSHAINRLHRLISELDIPALEQFHSSLMEKTDEKDKQLLNIFQKVLPLAGSRASIVFIRNLVRKTKVNEDIAIDLLNKVPFYLRMPSEKLLQEIEDLLDLGKDVSESVRKAGVLCFASLVHKVFAHKNWHQHEHQHIDEHNHLMFHNPGNWNSYHQHDEHPHDEHHREENMKQGAADETMQQGNQLLERYILKFINQLKAAQDYETQFLYMQALYNIQMGNVSKYLEPWVKGEVENSNRHLRFLAMCASLAGSVQDEEKVFKMYWPMLTNRNLHLELRIGAYLIIMSTRPTMSKLLNIYWVMQSEECPELYNFYFTHMKSLAATTNPTMQENKKLAQQIVRMLRRPYKKYMSGNYLYDYTDPKYNYGMMLQSMLISTSTSKTIFIDLTTQISNIPFNGYSLFLKIDGVDMSRLEKLPTEQNMHFNIKELQQLIKMLVNLQENKNLHIELVVLQNNQGVKIEYYNSKNVKQLVDDIKNIQVENNRLLRNCLDIQYNILAQMILPNDLGLPTIVQVKSPVTTNNIINLSKEIVNKITNIQGDMRLQKSLQTTHMVELYNPIVDIWQGVQRLSTYDQMIPLNFNLAVNAQQHSVKLTLNNNQDERKSTLGLRNFVASQTYIFKGEDMLRQSNGQCNPVEEVTRGKQFKKTNMFIDKDDENTGLRFQVGVFDSERQITHKSSVDLMNSIVEKSNRNDNKNQLMNRFLILRNLWSRVVLAGGVGTNGFIMRAEPSKVFPVTHIDLSFRCNQEMNTEENVQLPPGTRINSRATYSVKTTGDKLVKTWDVNAIFDLNPGHMKNNMKVQISKMVPEQKDFRICIDGIEKWSNTGVTGHMSIAMGHSADKQCVKDETLIEINVKGEQSTNQNKDNEDQYRNFDECAQVNLFESNLKKWQTFNFNPIDCVRQHTTIRDYEFDIKTTKMPNNLRVSMQKLLDHITGLNIHPFHSTADERKSGMEENNMKILVEFTPIGNEVNIQVLKAQESFNITGIKVLDTNLQTDNIHFSRKFLTLQRMGLVMSCLVNQRKMLNSENELVDKEVGDDWTEILSSTKQNTTVTVAVKKLQEQQNLLALRVQSGEQTLEIAPSGDQNRVVLNGETLSVDSNSYRFESWFSIGQLDDERQTLILHIRDMGLYIDYTGSNIKLDASKFGSKLSGRCVQ